MRGLNQSASDTARATVAGVNGGSENSVRWAEDRGLIALFVFFELFVLYDVTLRGVILRVLIDDLGS